MKLVTRPIRIVFACLLLTLTFLGGAPAQAKAETEGRITDTMDLTGILRDAKGNSITENKYVTRAEFAQMLVQSSADAKDAKVSKTTRLFRDVKASHAKADYIQTVVTKGYMSGYLGGKFKPGQAVTLREAAYGTLALLGYTSQDFADRLSGSRWEKFEALGLNKNISKKESGKLTEEDCENLFYNLLNAKQKSGEIYALSLNYRVDADGKIDYQALLEKKTKGPLLAAPQWEKKLPREITSYQLFYNNSRIAKGNIGDYSVLYYADQTNKLWIYDKKVYGCLEDISYQNGKPMELAVDGSSYSVEKPEDMKKLIESSKLGKNSMVVLLLGRDDKVAHILPMQSRVAGGDWTAVAGFAVSEGTVYRNGQSIPASEVKSTDIIYYSKELKTVWVYGKTVYGVLSLIRPSTSLPEQVTVAGVTYTLDAKPVNSDTAGKEGLRDITENAWGRRLRENGIKEGDNVAVAFGYDGKVAEISKVDTMPVTFVGYVLDVTDKVLKNERGESGVIRMLRIIETGGTVLELESSDSEIVKGSIVEISYQRSKAEIKKVEAYSSNSISDLPQRKYAEGIRIIEVKGSNYTKLTAAALKDITWNAGNAIYARINTEGEITDLMLTNVTDSFYQYGLLKKTEFPDYEKGIFSIMLTLDMGEETTLAMGDAPWDVNPGPKALRFENNTLKEMKALQRARLQYFYGKQASSGSRVYLIADDVLVFFYQNGEYYRGTYDSLPSSGSYNIDGYMENAQGPIRIIVVTK
jgi:hypothetical protein